MPVILVGRTVQEGSGAITFAWQGCGIIAVLSARERISVRLKTENGDRLCYIALVDGKPYKRLDVPRGEHTVTIAQGLNPGKYKVEIYRDSEAMFGLSSFLGFVDCEEAEEEGITGPTRLIEVIGDSLSAGYGNLAVEIHPNGAPSPLFPHVAETSSWYYTYGAMTGRAFNSHVCTIARSGWWGLTRGWQGAPRDLIPLIYNRALGPWSDKPAEPSSIPAHVVVINIGSNDWSIGDPGPAYEDAYIEFLRLVRTLNPGARLFLCIGPLPDNLRAEAVMRIQKVAERWEQATGEPVVAVDLGNQELTADGMTPTGASWHPSWVEHRRAAGVLQNFIADVMKWETQLPHGVN
ncbi:hypothetical protein BJ742DRAFT_910991 [Cladochytrium replicatum]|nr:hypothetical protein BJ742DRAFT_910991 [Cladochytrium replicatum]